MGDHDPAVSIFERRESGVRSYCRGFDATFVAACGARLTDTDGVEYIDFLAGCSSLNYGHNDPDMKAALIEHLNANGIAHGLDLHTSTKARFIESFERIILQPRGMDHRLMFTGPTGANAVEAALKIARKATGRQNVIAFTNGFHGVSLGALALTGNSYHRGGAGVALDGVTRMPYEGYLGKGCDTAELLERMLDDPSSGVDAPAAIVLETVQGEGGLRAASPAWTQRIAATARRHGALLIIDDVQAGCGRTGRFFSFESLGVTPDIVTLAKSISGFGLPMGLVLVRPQHDVLGPAEHNGTFRGNTHAFVTAQVAIEKFWRDGCFEASIARKASMVEAGLQAIADMVDGAQLVGRGMMRGVDLRSREQAARICELAWRARLVIETSGPEDEVVKVLAPLTISDDDLRDGLERLIDAASDVLRDAPQALAS